MRALLGEIVAITPEVGASADRGRFVVRWMPRCVLPGRDAVPEWLRAYTLTSVHEVEDPREIGQVGDSLLLSPTESTRWLTPLIVSPQVVEGTVPEELRLTLRWWHDDAPPEFVVSAHGRRYCGQFTRDQHLFSATVPTATFFSLPPTLPVTFTVTCASLRAVCTVLPAEENAVCPVALPTGPVQRLRNPWYTIDITAETHGGAIAALIERGRDIDHFQRDDDVIDDPLLNAGHTDRYKTGGEWSGTMSDAKLENAGGRCEDGVVRLSLDGTLDSTLHLRSHVEYLLYQALPLLALNREYQLSVDKSNTDAGTEKPRVPFDAVSSFGMGLRVPTLTEAQSRILCSDGTALVSVRLPQPNESYSAQNWRLADGWSIIEHPQRRASLLYLFAPATAPFLEIWQGVRSLSFEPSWQMTPLCPGQTHGYTLALAAGELCGAGADAAWVACRVPHADGISCAVIGRGSGKIARFTVGASEQECPLQTLLIPGVGEIRYATVDFSQGRMDDAFDVLALGLPTRR